jgi:hypothetical protein
MLCARFTRALAPWGALVLAAIAGCHARVSGSAAAAAPANAGAGCLPSHDGYLRARLRGARNLDVNWNDAQMQCDGGPRPEGHGIRLTFAGQAADHPLRFVFGITAVPESQTANNLPANVTVIFEGQGELYSTQGNDRCTVDELRFEPVASAVGDLRRVVARGFCIANATAVGSNAGVLISRFDFAGALPGT